MAINLSISLLVCLSQQMIDALVNVIDILFLCSFSIRLLRIVKVHHSNNHTIILTISIDVCILYMDVIYRDI